MAGLFGEETTDAENANVDSYMQQLSALDAFGSRLEENPTLDGGGLMEQFLFGGANSSPDERTGVQSFLRAVTSGADNELGEARAGRRQLISFDFKKAYDSLRGAGQITEFESRTASNAESLFGNEDATDEQLQREVQRIKDTMQAAQFREREGITISKDGLETMADGTPVLTYRDESGNFQYSQNPNGEAIYNIPDWLDDDTAKSAATSLPQGAKYFYQGQIYNRDAL